MFDEIKTPVTVEGLKQFDNLPAAQAVFKAWTIPGRNKYWHWRTRGIVRDTMPLLARALDRLSYEYEGTGEE